MTSIAIEKSLKQMNILFSTYPTAFHTPGGGEVQLLQYREFLPAESVNVTLFDPWEPSFQQFDVVHFFSCMSGSLHFCAFIKSLNLPLLVSPNLWITEDNKGNYPFDEIRTMFVLADRVVCNSNMECALLAKVFNIPREKFSTVYNGVNEEFFEPSDPRLFRGTFGIDGPFVLNVANIEARKNQINLIKAMREFPHLKLVLIGYQRDPEYAKACFAEGGDQVKYIGSLPHDSPILKSAYAACELFALPSTLETPGLAALEASACGAKLVITDEGCAQEYFGKGAEYVRHDDVSDIVRGIAQMMSQPRSLISTLVTRANFTWRQAARTLADLYREVKSGEVIHSITDGFHEIEYDGYRLFAWSLPEFGFSSAPGELKFLWRSVHQTLVDIFIDGLIVQRDLKVYREWSYFTLEIPHRKGSSNSSLHFKLRASDENWIGGKFHGVAMAEVTLTPFKSDHNGLPLAALDVPFIKNLTNFYSTETTVFRRQAWVRREPAFDCEPGLLTFWWSSLAGADVDIFVDDIAVQRNIYVSPDGAFHTLTIPHNGNSYRHVRFVVDAKQSQFGGDLRELAVAIGAFSLDNQTLIAN
ncbi:glycosyltransferase family 4 protein [Rhodoferax sp. GW822-FHT02A01]|uniref:glycosyltransferase family 4 protein n=1 Tax=Rhodoferax sp. GW822-FHT02A01 TaxID=3141537 RepID=UPI00315CF855